MIKCILVGLDAAAAVSQGVYAIELATRHGAEITGLAAFDLAEAERVGPVPLGVTAVAAIVITSVAVMGQLYQVEKRRRLVEPDALLVILLVFGMLGLLYYLR